MKTQEIYGKLKELFPRVIDWLPTDSEYLTIEPEQVQVLIEKYADPENRYIPNLWECEEIAIAFVVDVRRGRKNDVESIPVTERKNYAIGEALGTRWDGVAKSHQANIFIASDGVYLFDMQTKKTWKAEKGRDDIFFVRM